MTTVENNKTIAALENLLSVWNPKALASTLETAITKMGVANSAMNDNDYETQATEVNQLILLRDAFLKMED